MKSKERSTHPYAFTLVELLIVIGIIAILIGLLLPTLNRARDQANSTKCKSNMQQVFIALITYMNDNHGWLYPVGPEDANGVPRTWGADNQTPPWIRWPMYVFKFHHPQMPTPNPGPVPWVAAGPNAVPPAFDAQTWSDAGPWTPLILLCPTDYEPVAAHSYVLNKHLADRKIRYSTKSMELASSDIVLMGEKKTDIADYYMEKNKGVPTPPPLPPIPPNLAKTTEFDNVVEIYRHGIRLGSNYLYKDGHVDIVAPKEAKDALDAWDP